MIKIIDELIDKKISPDVLLLNPPTEEKEKTIVEEVIQLEEKMSKFGVNNTTFKKIQEVKAKNVAVKTKNEKIQKKHIKKKGLSLIASMMLPYAIVDYTTMHQICKDYNLIISSLQFYNKVIEEENIDEMQLFQEHMVKLMDKRKDDFIKEYPQRDGEKDGNFENRVSKNIHPFSKKISFPNNRNFTFNDKKEFSYLMHVDFSRLLNIVAPESHFDFKDENVVAIGREVKPYKKKPSFKYEFKVNLPEPKDPIVVAPFMYFDKVYFMIVTAWDKVADDSRIRAKLTIE